MTDKWNQNINIELIANGLQKIRLQDPQTGKHSGFEGFLYEDYISVLFSSYAFSPEIPEFERRQLIMAAVRAVAEKGEITAKLLKGEIIKQENLYLKLPLQKFVFVTSLSFKYFNSLTRLSVLGGRFLFSRSLPSTFSREPALETVKK